MFGNRLIAGVCIAVLGACGGKALPPPARKPVVLQPPPRPAPAAFPGAPSTPAGQQLAWALDAIVTRKGKVARAELEAHFAPSFVQQVPIDELGKLFVQAADQLPGLVLTSVDGAGDELAGHAVVGEIKLRIDLAIDDKQQIAALRIQPERASGPRISSFEEAIHTASSLGAKASLLVAQLDKGACKPIQELAASDELAIGSTFKLYVLLGLADKILAGKAKWTDELAVRDDWKSLPSGITQNEPPGTKHSLQLLAERMISISDNTAADHLLYTVGRKQVEAALRSTKHARPALDAPFLSTRELFVMKLGTPAPELDQYGKWPEARRRDYLDRTLAPRQPNINEAAAWKTARRIDTIEWFASAQDLCKAMNTLLIRAQDPRAAAVLDVLAKNPGLPVDKKAFPYVGFKGGSEPGVLNMTYLLHRDDGAWFVVVIGLNAEDGKVVDDKQAFSLASDLIELTATVNR
ncbi:MAG TPA: serine hydrolase [Kofleriaceae bacterium]